jgi:hypothetical protein
MVATNVVTLLMSFSEESTIPDKKLVSSFRQLTNSEFAQYCYGQAKLAAQTTPVPQILRPFANHPFSEFAKQPFSEEVEKCILLHKGGVYFAVDLFIIYHREYHLGDSKNEYTRSLEWDIETDKTVYQIGEPIGLVIFIRNTSDKTLTLSISPLIPVCFYPNSIALKRIENDKKEYVLMTESGFKNYISFTGRSKRANAIINRPLSPNERQQLYTISSQVYYRYKPSDFFSHINEKKSLNWYYDLSQPGEYELTFYTRNFLADDKHQIAEYPKPCTIRFKIENQIYKPEIQWNN